ncbi:unnamed protein product [Larinioides sclopetarius]|uniref:Uncharacterized protein n=1 Tax=Larinioides sclopetarius TaxID=280406 RepID=A0AAV1ZC19_9ARAC
MDGESKLFWTAWVMNGESKLFWTVWFMDGEGKLFWTAWVMDGESKLFFGRCGLWMITFEDKMGLFLRYQELILKCHGKFLTHVPDVFASYHYSWDHLKVDSTCNVL